MILSGIKEEGKRVHSDSTLNPCPCLLTLPALGDGAKLGDGPLLNVSAQRKDKKGQQAKGQNQEKRAVQMERAKARSTVKAEVNPGEQIRTKDETKVRRSIRTSSCRLEPKDKQTPMDQYHRQPVASRLPVFIVGSEGHEAWPVSHDRQTDKSNTE